MRPRTRGAQHSLVRICFVIGRIVSNPAFNNQAGIGAAERECRHAASNARIVRPPL